MKPGFDRLTNLFLQNVAYVWGRPYDGDDFNKIRFDALCAVYSLFNHEVLSRWLTACASVTCMPLRNRRHGTPTAHKVTQELKAFWDSSWQYKHGDDSSTNVKRWAGSVSQKNRKRTAESRNWKTQSRRGKCCTHVLLLRLYLFCFMAGVCTINYIRISGDCREHQ